MIRNEVGLGLGADGQWHSPWVEQDGAWVRRTDIEWAPEAPAMSGVERAERMLAKVGAFPAFTLNGVRVTPRGPVSRDGATITVQVAASRTPGNHPLYVGDGVFQFVNPPLSIDGGTEDPLATLRRILVDTIERIQP